MNRLHPQFIVALRGDVMALHQFSRVAFPTRSQYIHYEGGGLSPFYLIAGEAAEWLHLALTGRRCEEDPGTASPDLARCARAYLDCHRLQPGGFYAAHKVALCWADFISPTMHPRLERVAL